MQRDGRPPGVYAGIDVGGTKTAVVLVDDAESVVGRARVPTRTGPAGIVASIASAIAEAGIGVSARTPLLAVGVGVPGIVDSATGTVARAVNIGLHGFPLADATARALGVPVWVDNDVTLAALGLAWSSDARRSLAYLNLGTGFGVGIVIDGSPLRGRHGAAGEIGHLPFDPRGERCECGLTGCLELYASGSALVRAAGSRSVSRLLADARSGNPASAAILEKFSAALALGLRIVVQAYDVDTVVLGGGVFASAATFMPRVREIIADWEEASSFLGGLDVVGRLRIIDDVASHATRGAARWAIDRRRTTLTENGVAPDVVGVARGGA